MQIRQTYSHLYGLEFLLVHKPELWKEIQQVIAGVDAERCKTKISKEKTTKGKLLYSPAVINSAFKFLLEQNAWKDSRESCKDTNGEQIGKKIPPLSHEQQKAEIENSGEVAIFSYNQTDFAKNRVALEVQLGKYSFGSYDLLAKHLAFYVGDKIDVGIEILPMKTLQSQMSSGVAYYEGEFYNVVR